MPVRSRDTLAAELNALHRAGITWRQIAALARFCGVPAGTLCAIAKGYEPKSPDLRAKLGLPPTATVVSVDGAIPDGTQVPGHAICVQCGAPFTPNVHNRAHCYRCVERGGKSPIP